jgi:glutamate--cysteine ligase catalytic subunit
MGLLVEGQPLPPEELKKVMAYIREHGVQQFLHTWRRLKDVQNDELKFGDEIECGIFAVDNDQHTVKLSIRGAEIRSQLKDKEKEHSHEAEGCTWHPEYGAWMVESTPSRPYTGYAADLLRIERNMVIRRRRLLSALRENEIAPTVTCFPLMGVGDFIENPQAFEAPASQSDCVPDYVINSYPRFAALTRNIRTRRGGKVNIQIPLFQDSNTPEFQGGAYLPSAPMIHMDAMVFGMGMCCLQVTFQARDVDESRYMYDQMAVLAPIMMAMTAATPFFKGRVADIDARWTVISQSVDDRTDAERGLISSPEQLETARDPCLAGGGIRRIPKSRYDSISTYIYHCKGEPDCQRTFAEYNDISCPIADEFFDTLRAEGIDENLAHHICHLFIRDPIVAYAGKIELDDEDSTDHFESIQSTNWQSCRWKPPPHLDAGDPHIGWRAEFRSMEVQLTDFENAAFTVFFVLLTRCMLAFDIGFYIPLSNVDENMRRAHLRDAVNTQKFYFRKHIAPPEDSTDAPVIPRSLSSDHLSELVALKSSPGSSSSAASTAAAVATTATTLGSVETTPTKRKCAGKGPTLKKEDDYEEMTMSEIFLGKEDYYPGLLPLIYAYLEFINCDATTMDRVSMYLEFIEKRATGELMTPSTWMRKFVKEHPAYQHDSVITQQIAHDLLTTCHGIGTGAIPCPEILGEVVIDRVRKEDAYGSFLQGHLNSQERATLIATLVKRANQPRSAHVARGKSR